MFFILLKSKILDNEYSNYELNNYLKYSIIKNHIDIVNIILSLDYFKYDNDSNYIKEVIYINNYDVIHMLLHNGLFYNDIFTYRSNFLNIFINYNDIELIKILINKYELYKSTNKFNIWNI